MTVDLEKIDIINLVRSTTPYYNDMIEITKMKLGYYIGGFSDEWFWLSKNDSAWDNFTEQELLDLYKKLKH